MVQNQNPGATKLSQITTIRISKKSFSKEVLGNFKDCPVVLN